MLTLTIELDEGMLSSGATFGATMYRSEAIMNYCCFGVVESKFRCCYIRLLIKVVSLKWCSRRNAEFGLSNSFGSKGQTCVLAASFSIVMFVVVLSAYVTALSRSMVTVTVVAVLAIDVLTNRDSECHR